MSQRNVIVVTGATGRVGHLVVERLLAVGHSVRAVGRTADKLTPLAGLGADVRPGSYDERAFLASAFKGANAAFVLTPVDISAKDVNEVQYKVIEGLVEAIRDSSVRHVVLLSSWELSWPRGSVGSSAAIASNSCSMGSRTSTWFTFDPSGSWRTFSGTSRSSKWPASTALRSRQTLHSR